MIRLLAYLLHRLASLLPDDDLHERIEQHMEAKNMGPGPFARHVTAALRRGEVLTPMTVALVYSPRSPLEVTMWMGAVRWRFGRDLLREGVQVGDGVGDVVIRPVAMGVEILLRSPDGQTVLVFRRDDLIEFLRATEQLVPFGSENVDALVRQVTRD